MKKLRKWVLVLEIMQKYNLLILKLNFKGQISKDFSSKYTFSNLLITHLYSPRNNSILITKATHYSVINNSLHKWLTQTTQNTYPAITHYSNHSLLSPLYRVFYMVFIASKYPALNTNYSRLTCKAGFCD